MANRDGGPLSYTQFKRLWQYVVTRTAKPRIARKLVDGKYVKYMLYPELGEKARNNGHVVYSLDLSLIHISVELSMEANLHTRKFLSNVIQSSQGNALKAVSYTHLDVYKRQLWACAMS